MVWLTRLVIFSAICGVSILSWSIKSLGFCSQCTGQLPTMLRLWLRARRRYGETTSWACGFLTPLSSRSPTIRSSPSSISLLVTLVRLRMRLWQTCYFLMKTPRLDDFAPTNTRSVKELHSPLDDMPRIEKPAKTRIQGNGASTRLHASMQTGKPASMQAGLHANLQTGKPAKFSSYLGEESVRSLKRVAFETNRKDYEVLQEAVDRYLEQVE